MPFRKNKISYTFRGNDVISSLTLKGKWFEQLGFKTGDQVAIYEDMETIVITKISAEDLEIINNLEKKKQIKKLQKELKQLTN